MFVARSYHFSASKGSSAGQDYMSEKEKPRRPGLRQRPPPVPLPRKAAPHTTSQTTTIAAVVASPPRSVSEPVAVPSKPVIIPRTISSTSTQSGRTRTAQGARSSKLSSYDDHNPRALRPAVAALLAVTSIPPPNKQNPARHRSIASTTPRRVSIDELVQSWKNEDESRSSSYTNSVLEHLLEQPDEETDNSSLSEAEEDKSFLTSRSVSSESIPSTPGLDADERSLLSWNSPFTPTQSLQRASVAKAKEKCKGVASPPLEDCALDHPLLRTPTIPHHDADTYFTLTPTTPVQKPQSFLKSNLTASFQALKSAARSFSNFTAPSVPPDDLLTRSILSPVYRSEMRPKPSQGLPGPQLRRYLNPTSARPPSPTELSMQVQEAIIHAHLNDTSTYDDSYDQPMIQMQTYSRSSRPSNRSGPNRRKRGSDASTELGRIHAAVDPALRQREPRENSDFLRVIVLEMNMRREGKLDSKAPGRARLWLPPRQSRAEEDEQIIAGRVPVRWVGLGVDDYD
jgi:hypothetical protein